MNIGELLRKSPASERNFVCEYPAAQLSVSLEYPVLSELAADLHSGSYEIAAGVLLGMVMRTDGRTNVEIGACTLFKSAFHRSPGDANPEKAIDAELRNYPPATARAPGCVGYFRVGSVGERGPGEKDRENFFRRSHGAAQLFLFIHRPESGAMSAELFLADEGRLTPLPMAPVKFGIADNDGPFLNLWRIGDLWPINFSKRRTWTLVSVLAAAVAVAIFFAYRMRTAIEPAQSAVADPGPGASRPNSVQLDVAREGDSLTLQWDREAPAVRSARMGILVIEDGDRNSQQTLDPADLSSGKIVYLASDTNVRFRLDLLSNSGTMETASIRVLGSTSRSVANHDRNPVLTAETAQQPSRIPAPSQQADNAVRNRVAPSAPPAAPSTVSGLPIVPAALDGLDLRVESGGSREMQIRWNRGAAAIADSRQGLLVLTEGNSERRVTLDPQELRNGAMSYLPDGSNVRVQLHVITRTNRTVTESVRFVTHAPVSPGEIAAAKPAAPSPAPAEIRKPATPATQPVDQTQTEVRASASENESASDAQPSLTAQNTVEPPAALPSPPKSATTYPRASPQVRTSSTPQGPKVKRRTIPSIPLALQSTLRRPSRTPIVVSVKVMIDANGAVTNARLDNPRMGVVEKQLENLATAAARYWTFYPATINSKPVPSEMLINFRF